MERFEDKVRRGGSVAMVEVDRFFMEEGAVYECLRRITGTLNELAVPYAIAGGMALVGHGYKQMTANVDIVVDPEGLTRLYAALDRISYARTAVPGNHLRDLETGVRIKFLVSGQYPGDGEPKPVAFPDPVTSGIAIKGIPYLRLEKLIELKLASGMTNRLRLKDLADVQELIRHLGLDDKFGERLDPYVRDLYLTLWRELQVAGQDQ